MREIGPAGNFQKFVCTKVLKPGTIGGESFHLALTFLFAGHFDHNGHKKRSKTWNEPDQTLAYQASNFDVRGLTLKICLAVSASNMARTMLAQAHVGRFPRRCRGLRPCSLRDLKETLSRSDAYIWRWVSLRTE